MPGRLRRTAVRHNPARNQASQAWIARPEEPAGQTLIQSRRPILGRRHALNPQHNTTVSDIPAKIEELVDLMDEFGLDTVKFKDGDTVLELSFVGAQAAVPLAATAAAPAPARRQPKAAAPAAATAAAKGIPISSPMTGVYYSSPNPGSPPFVKVGDRVDAGQVVGLIEAMKVFNEITATVAGTVTEMNASNGQLVQPGDPLLYIG